jgi:hypothetical protein
LLIAKKKQTAQEQPPSAAVMVFLRPLEKGLKEKKRKRWEHVTGAQTGLCLPGVMGHGGEQTATGCLYVRKRGHVYPYARTEHHAATSGGPLTGRTSHWSKASQTHNANMTVAALITPHTHENRVLHSQSRRQAILATWLGGRVQDVPRRWVGLWGLLTVALWSPLFLDNNF